MNWLQLCVIAEPPDALWPERISAGNLPMKVCILDNDVIDPRVSDTYKSYTHMFAELFHKAGADDWEFVGFHPPRFDYPDSFDQFDAVLLTGSRHDSFSDEPWIVRLREVVTELLASHKKLIGICFGHQLIAYCLGARVGRNEAGWSVGHTEYQWHDPDFSAAGGREQITLLASHQDQVHELPEGARLLASNDFCPVAAFVLDDKVFCVQPHPEFVEPYTDFLLEKNRERIGEEKYHEGKAKLGRGHEGEDFARMMKAFVEGN